MRSVWNTALAGMITLTATECTAASYLCVAESSGGLKFFDGRWQGTAFRLANETFVITPAPNSENEFVAKEVGKSSPKYRCSFAVLTDGTRSEMMRCGGLGYGMSFDAGAMRYTEIYTFGYIEDDKSGGNTPFVTGGKCTELDP